MKAGTVIFDFQAERKSLHAEPSRAENPSARRAMARANSAWTHHYYLL